MPGIADTAGTGPSAGPNAVYFLGALGVLSDEGEGALRRVGAGALLTEALSSRSRSISFDGEVGIPRAAVRGPAWAAAPRCTCTAPVPVPAPRRLFSARVALPCGTAPCLCGAAQSRPATSTRPALPCPALPCTAPSCPPRSSRCPVRRRRALQSTQDLVAAEHPGFDALTPAARAHCRDLLLSCLSCLSLPDRKASAPQPPPHERRAVRRAVAKVVAAMWRASRRADGLTAWDAMVIAAEHASRSADDGAREGAALLLQLVSTDAFLLDMSDQHARLAGVFRSGLFDASRSVRLARGAAAAGQLPVGRATCRPRSRVGFGPSCRTAPPSATSPMSFPHPQPPTPAPLNVRAFPTLRPRSLPSRSPRRRAPPRVATGRAARGGLAAGDAGGG